jgi:hypothetical protein
MNKKLIALAVAGVVAAPVAMADLISWSGDARYRAANFGSLGDAKNILATGEETANSRIRIAGKVATDENVSLNFRVKFDEAHGGGGSAGSQVGDAVFDYAFIDAKFGMFSVRAGDFYATWGIGFKVNDAHYQDRVNVVANLGGFNVGYIRLDGQGVDGTPSTAGNHDNDGMFITGKTGDTTWGLITRQNQGAWVDAFVKTKVGPASIAAEYSKGGGAKNDSTAAKDDMGLVIHATMNFDAVNGHLIYVQTKDGFTASHKFTPYSLVGKDQTTGLINIGDVGDWSHVALGVDGKAAGWSLVGMAGTTTISPAAGSDIKFTLVDLKATHPIGKASSFQATYGQVSGDVVANAFGINVNTKW